MSDVRSTHIGGTTTLLEVAGWRLLTDPTFDPPAASTTSARARGRASWPGRQSPPRTSGRSSAERMLQAVSDPFLGLARFRDRGYLRQFRDMKGSDETDGVPAAPYPEYSEVCGGTAHSGTQPEPHAAATTGDLAKSDRVDRAGRRWAIACADHTERLHAALRAAIKSGSSAAEQGV